MQLEMGFPSSHQLKSYVAYKSRLKLAARAVLSADAGLLVIFIKVVLTDVHYWYILLLFDALILQKFVVCMHHHFFT